MDTAPALRARVSFIGPDGAEASLYPGDFVGRSHAAALRLDDPRVSEAHGMVSLRGDQLKLLALRGMLAIDARPLTEVVLQPGLVVRLAKGVSLGVSSVDLPTHTIAIEGEGLDRQVLSGHSASLVLASVPVLRRGYVDQAAAYLWSDGEGFCARVGDGEVIRLIDGATFTIGGVSFRAVAVALESLAAPSTRVAGGLHPPLRIVVNFDTAAVHRPGHPPLGLGGMPARILSELVALDGPAHWSVIAETLWRGIEDDLPLRRRWDRNLARLRVKLRDAGIRPDLIRSDGSGRCELFLYEGDETVDRT